MNDGDDELDNIFQRWHAKGNLARDEVCSPMELVAKLEAIEQDAKAAIQVWHEADKTQAVQAVASEFAEFLTANAAASDGNTYFIKVSQRSVDSFIKSGSFASREYEND